jgi:c-di-GMP-binding flagellar brake protein YcgR
VIQLPRINQPVSLLVPDIREPLASRVEDMAYDWLALAAPSSGDRLHWLRPGTKIRVQWGIPRGLGTIAAVVRETMDIGVEAVVVDLVGEPEIVQRRRHVRADCCVRIVVTPALPDDERQPAIGTTLDVAGGGVRARVSGEFQPGDLVRTRLFLDDDEEVSALARVVRRVGDETVALEFEDISVQERERLVRYVFRRLRQSLAVRSGC